MVIMTEHCVSLFFDFTFAGGDASERVAGLQLAQTAHDDWLHPARLAAGAARPIGKASVWDWTAWDLSPDFHPFARDVLNSASSDIQVPQPLRLSRSASAKALLEGRYRAPAGERPGPSGLVLTLGTAGRLCDMDGAQEVLLDGGAAGVAVGVEIESLTVHMFRTGVGLIVPRLRLKPLKPGADIAPGLLIEIIPRLGDERRHAGFGWLDGWTAPDPPRFTLSTLMRRLIEPAGCRLAERERTYTYVTVVAGELAAGAERDIAFRLSRHYNAIYRPAPDFPGTIFVQPFETVLHAASREGACTLVTPGRNGPAAEFLGTWLEQSDPHAYFPLQVAAVHEHVALLELAQGAGTPIEPGAHDPATIAKLRALRDRFLLFRLRYRLLQVSSITAHEMAFAATVQALGIEALSTKIARDLIEVERRLVELAAERASDMQLADAARDRRRERRIAPLTGLASGALAYITMASFGDHLVGFFKDYRPIPEDMKFVLEVFFQVIGVALACWSFYYSVWWKHGDHHEVEHVIQHQQTELRLARHHSEGDDSKQASVEAPRRIG